MITDQNLTIDKNLYGNIGITPVGTLEETANILGQALGLEFYEDDTGSFDEFPTFRAEGFDCEFALLGIPDPEYHMRSEPLTDFQLKIENHGHKNIDKNMSVAEYFARIIRQSDLLECDQF